MSPPPTPFWKEKKKNVKEHGEDAGDHVGDYDGGASFILGPKACEDVDANTDDFFDAEPDEVPLHLV